MHLKMWNQSSFLSSIWLHTTTSPSCSYLVNAFWNLQRGGRLPKKLVHKKTYKCLIADKCDKKWGWLYMNGKGIQMSKCGERGQRMVHVLHELKMHRNIQMRVNGPGGWLISGYSLWCRSCIIAIYGHATVWHICCFWLKSTVFKSSQ